MTELQLRKRNRKAEKWCFLQKAGLFGEFNLLSQKQLYKKADFFQKI